MHKTVYKYLNQTSQLSMKSNTRFQNLISLKPHHQRYSNSFEIIIAHQITYALSMHDAQITLIYQVTIFASYSKETKRENPSHYKKHLIFVPKNLLKNRR